MNLCHLGILLPAAFEIKNDVNVWDQRIDNFLTILWQSHKWNWQFSDSSKRIDDKDLWASGLFLTLTSKVEKILKDSLDLTSSPSPSVKIQIICGKVGLRCKGKTLLDIFFFSKVCWHHPAHCYFIRFQILPSSIARNS